MEQTFSLPVTEEHSSVSWTALLVKYETMTKILQQCYLIFHIMHYNDVTNPRITQSSWRKDKTNNNDRLNVVHLLTAS